MVRNPHHIDKGIARNQNDFRKINKFLVKSFVV